MKRFFLLIPILIGVSGCAGMKPDGNLKRLSEGTLFNSQPSRPIPADNTALPSRDETDVNWKLAF